MKKANKLMVEKETMAVEMQQGARSNYQKRSTLKKRRFHGNQFIQSKVSKTTTPPHKKVKNVRKLSMKRKIDLRLLYLSA